MNDDPRFKPLAEGVITAPAASATVHGLQTISEGATRLRLQNLDTANHVYLRWNNDAAATTSFDLWPWMWVDYEWEAARLKELEIIGTGAESVYVIQEQFA